MVDGLVTQKLNYVAETSMVIDWESNYAVDCVWYSTNGGINWSIAYPCDGLVGSYCIEELAPANTYNVRTRVRLKNLMDTIVSETLEVQTHSYPYAIETPDFIIGDDVSLTLYNPLNREVKVDVLGEDGSEIFSKIVSGILIDDFVSEGIVNNFYASIPRAKSGKYKVKVTCDNQVTIRDGGVYTVNEDDCRPSIGECFYFNTDDSINEVLNDPKLILRNVSSVKLVAKDLKSNQSAVIVSCSVSINGILHDMELFYPYDIAIVENLRIDSSADVVATIIVTDSRGVTNAKDILISMLDWELPVASIDLERQDGFKPETNINVSAICSDINGKNDIEIKARYKRAVDDVYGEDIVLENNVQDVWVLDELYEWHVQVVVSDKIGSRTYNLFVESGIPIVFFDSDKRSMGINCLPADSNSVELNGINLTHNIITAYFSKKLIDLTPGEFIKLGLVNAIGECRALSLCDGGIRIGENVHYIKVSATLLLVSNTSEGRGMLITKNDTEVQNWVGAVRNYCEAGCSHSLILPPKIIEVQPNDIIYWYYTAVDKDDILCGDVNGLVSYLTVEVVN